MTDWRDKLKAARLPEKTVSVVTRGDLVAEHEALTRQIEQAEAQPATSLAGSGVSDQRHRLRELEAEMQGSVLEFRLRALPRTKRPGDPRPSFSELKAQHPPRESDGQMVREDIMAGFVNALTFPEPLVKASVVDPELTDADWDELPLSQGQFDELVKAAWDLNQGSVDIPFSSAGSATARSSSAG